MEDYKILKIQKNDNNHLGYKNIEKGKYAKVLANLLNINPRSDKAVFTKIDNKSNFDLFYLLKNENDIKKIYTNSNFKIRIPRQSIEDIKQILENINTLEELTEKKEELNISTSKITLYKSYLDSNIEFLKEQPNWKVIEKEIIEINKEQIKSFNGKWKRYIKKIKDIYDQENIWPLYVGTYFIKVNINGKPIYAPLILKEIEIQEEKTEIYILSKNSSLIINEKVVFFLEQYKKINLPLINNEIEDIALSEVVEELNDYLRYILKHETESVFEPFKRLKTEDVRNSEYLRCPGLNLLICNPIGSSLRKAVLDLNENNKLPDPLINFSADDLLNIDDTKYVEKIIDQKSIFRICQTDFSQEKAIFSALDKSTIIIGPPGTGKSQTIANIITNILKSNKKVAFISQKKVALEVVLERLKSLKYFTFQLIENSSKTSMTEKQHFYDNLNKYLSYWYSDSNNYQNLNIESKPLVSDKLKKYWQTKNENIEQDELDNFCSIYKKIDLTNLLIESFERNFDYYQNFDFNIFSTFKYTFSFLNESKTNLFKENKFSNLDWNIKKFFSLFAENKHLFDFLNWDIFNFLNENLFKKIINNFDLSSIKTFLNKFDSIIKKINELNYGNRILEILEFNFTNLNSKNYNPKFFYQHFQIEQKKVLWFKKYDKSSKQLWEVNEKLVDLLIEYEISKEIITFLLQYDYLNRIIQNIDLILFFIKIDIDKSNFDILKENKTSLVFWTNNFDFYLFLIDSKLDLSIIDNIKKIKNFENVKLIFKIFEEHHNKLVPDINTFENNEKVVLEELIKNNKKEYDNLSLDEKRKLRTMWGQIEKGKAKPHVFMNKYKDLFKKLFKVVVSTPETLGSYVDFLEERYDYIIFDEASQMFLEKAIPFLAIGDKIIIAGDDQQMQPTNWFSSRLSEESEEEQEEENIDSLLTYAIESGISKQVLELNYRSKFANLTSFSSRHFYDSKLKGIDENVGLINSNSIEVIDVDGKWEKSYNEKEVRYMIKLLKENINKYEKIILLTFNKTQMDCLDYFLSSEEPQIYNEILNSKNIIIKNLENIQGDEADLVIISVSYDKNTKLAGTYVCRNGGRNALNVAITRAKNKMIVLKSIYSKDIFSNNNANIQLFKEWVEFIDLHFDSQKIYSIPKNEINNSILFTESGFEKEVVQWLGNQHFVKQIKIETQFPVDSYRIDIALLDKETNKFLLGIEVDGFKKTFSSRQKYENEIKKTFIEVKGYRIIRIPELLWKINKNKIKDIIDFYLDEANNKKDHLLLMNELKEKIFKSEEKLQSNNSAQIDYNLDFNLQKNYSISKNDINNSFLFTESGFEKEVVQWLGNQHFVKQIKIETQFPVDSYRIDIALLDKETNKFLLGIEVDGFKYHSSFEQKSRDKERQDYIESKGYKIIRISEFEWENKRDGIENKINFWIFNINRIEN